MSNILVTGGMGGIGTEIVRLFLERGDFVIITHRNKNMEQLQCWASKNDFSAESIEFISLDLLDFESTRMTISNLVEKIDIDVLVNNAGVASDSTFCKMSWEQWSSVIDINLKSLFAITQPVAISMSRRRSGRVINISSVNGQKGQFGQSNYCASKAGIIGFTKSLALELATKGVSVNCIAPGYTQTNMLENIPKEVLESIQNGIPIKRFIQPIEIAKAVVFLSDCNESITGTTLSINGAQYLS